MKVAMLAIVIVLLGAGIGVYALTRSSPERIVCTKVGKLCGEQGSVSDLNKCVDDLERASKQIGDERMKQTAACVDKSQSCPEAVGCVAGTGVSVLKDAMGEFFKGFGRTLFPEPKK